jgi:transposase
VLLAKGILIEYLPLYSPDFNPIEMTFYTLKEWLRRHATEAERFETYGEFVLEAIEQAISYNCTEYFVSYRYKVP